MRQLLNLMDHFANYDTNIFTPVIRTQVREAIPEKKNHFTVYLPAYSDKRIIKILSQVHHIRWEVFSKNSKKKYKENNVKVSPICNDTFIESMVNSTGVLCGAGFETPAEVLFLKKKLMVIPMKGQYEQQCNAAALENMGVEVIKSLKNKFVKKITAWCTSEEYIGVNYLNETESIIDKIIATHSFDQTLEITKQSKNDFSLNEFKKISVPTNLK